MEIKGGEKGALRLHQLESEPNLWKILQEGGEEEEERRLKGLLMTYVDDICVVGDQETVNNTMEKIREKWKTSVPDSIGEVPIRFLGMEVAKLKDPETEREVWYVFQASYIKDLISKAGEEVKKKKVPITRDQSAQLGEKDEKVEVEDVRQSQKQVGELLSAMDRDESTSRPDVHSF